MTTSRTFGLLILAIVALSTSPAALPCVSTSPSFATSAPLLSAPAHKASGLNRALRLLAQ